MFRRLMDILKSCRDEKINSSVYIGLCFGIFSYFQKMEKVPERLFRHFGHDLRTQYQNFESFSDSFQAHKNFSSQKRNLLESPLNSFRTP